MAPKRKAAAKAPAAGRGGGRGRGRGAAGAADAAAAAHAAAVVIAANAVTVRPAPNAEIYANLESMVRELTDTDNGCACFSQIQSANPSGFDAGGREAPYNSQAFTGAMANAGEYKASINIFWLSIKESDIASSEVPLSEKGLARLQAHHYSTPKPNPYDITVALKDGMDPLNHKGELERISPPEPFICLIRTIYDAWKKGADDDTMQKWRRTCLTQTAIFKIIETNDDKYFEQMQSRQDVIASYLAIKRTIIQEIKEVVAFRNRKNKNMTATEVCNLYKASKVKWAGSTDDEQDERPTSLNFVESALSISDRMLSIPAIEKMLVASQENTTKPNPFDKMSKLSAILHKAVTADRAEFSIELLLDLYYSNALTYEQMGSRSLEGKTAEADGKGLVDLMVFKMTSLPYLTGEWLDSLALPSDVKATIREVTKSIKIFREKAGYAYNPNMAKVSTTWRAGWSKAAECAFELLEVGRFMTHVQLEIFELET